MQEKSNNEVQETPCTFGLVAVFLAGLTLATTVAIIAARAQGDKMARKTDSVMHACDRAIEKLEQRVQAADIALAG